MKAIHLNLGEPGYAPPEQALLIAARAALTNQMPYAPPCGLAEVREAIAERASARMLPVNPEQVVMTVGASMALFASLAAIMQPGDELLVPNPGYPAYQQLARTLRLVPRPYTLQASSRFLPVFGEMARQVNERTRALVWNSPANPTGATVEYAGVVQIAEFAERHNLFLISDEVYDTLVLDGTHCSPAEMAGAHRTFSIFSFSKTYALFSWRIGYVIAPLEFVSAVEQIQWSIAMCPCTVSQIAALECLKAPATYYADIIEWLRTNRDAATALLERFGIPYFQPQGGFFIWADIRAVTKDDRAFAARLWDEARVSVMPGSSFGSQGQGHIRILFGGSLESVTEGITRIGEFYQRSVCNRNQIEAGHSSAFQTSPEGLNQ